MVAATTITPRDRELIAALDDPASIDPVEYAQWVERPEIQKLIAARDDLKAREDRARAREEHAKLTRFRDRVLTEADAALDNLKAVLARDKDSDERFLEARRAATSITSLARSCLRPILPAGGGERRSREVGAFSTPASPTRATGRAPDLDSSPDSSLIPHRSSLPASRVPGLEAAIAAFIRAAGTANATARHGEATRLIANHRAIELGDDLSPWLESRVAPLRAAAARPARAIYHDGHDAAEQFVELTHPDGAQSQYTIHAVLERLPDFTPSRWAIDDVKPDTS